jgi:hypothetical protein
MERHVEALYTHDAHGRLLRVREHNGAPAPRFFLGRTPGGLLCRCRQDVGDALCSALKASTAADPVDFSTEVASEGRAVDASRYVNLLAPPTKVWCGPAFRFPTEIVEPPARHVAADGAIVLVTGDNVDVLRPLLAPWVPDVKLSPPLMALVVDGQAVAVCASVRITDTVHEAGVDTAAPFRGRGYAPKVVAAWAQAVRTLGAEPLYSTSWHNTASRAVARKLELIVYGTDLSVA